MNKGRGLELPDGLIDLHGGALMCWTASVWCLAMALDDPFAGP